MMIFAIIAFIVIGLVIWSAISLSVTSGNEKVATTGAGGAAGPGFPSPKDVWNSMSAPSGVGGAYSAASSTWGSVSAAGNSAWNSTAAVPPKENPGTPAPPAPAGGIFSFIPGWDQATGTNVSTPVTAVPGAPHIVEGKSYRCSSQPGTIYRGFNNSIRVYPSPTIAASWDTRWGNATTIDCSKLERGPPMEMNPDPKMIEGHAYTCAEGGVYRAMNGMLRWYPNVPIAASWDPAWASPVKIDCSGVKKGHPMQMAPSPAAAAASAPLPVKPDTSAAEKRMNEVVGDLNYLHGIALWGKNNATAKDREDEYQKLKQTLSSAGVNWTKPAYGYS